MVTSLQPRPHIRLGMHPQAPSSRLVPISLRVAFVPSAAVFSGGRAKSCFPRCGCLSPVPLRSLGLLPGVVPPLPVRFRIRKWLVLGSVPFPPLLWVEFSLALISPDGGESHDKMKLVIQNWSTKLRARKSSSLCKIRRVSPVEVDPPITDGVSVPSDLVVWLLWDGNWVFVGFGPAPSRP